MKTFLLIIALLAIARAQVCRPTANLQALDQSYMSHEDHILFGRLSACPRVNEGLSENIRYRLVTPIDGLIIQETSGDIEYTPPEHYSGTIGFDYVVEDELERSEPARVTISIREIADDPQLDVSEVLVGLEGDDMLLDIRASLDDTDGSEKLTVALCSCAQDITCNRYSGKCHCHLSMPEGWQIFNSNNQPLSHNILTNLGATDLNGLTLRPAPFSSGEHCLDVYAISQDRNNFDRQGNRQSQTKRQMMIHVKPLVKDPIITHADKHTPNNITELYTMEGQPLQFNSLSVKDNDGIQGSYRVRVSVNEGGTVWVRQDIRDDVVFFPKEKEMRANPKTNKKNKRIDLLDRDADFATNFEAHNTSMSSNGKTTLEFMGSLDGVNAILSSLMFVPWCSQWPTPPNWNLPEDSWMVPSPWDEVAGMNNEDRPVVWPQWYPRFWYPFPIKSWSWWPRTLPPYWLEHTCSDWTSRIHLEAQEITPQTCDVDTNHPKAIWDADVHVESRSSTPKSLITDNLFTYFSADATRFLVKNIYIRSREQQGKLRFRLSVNSSIGTVENMETRLPTFSCNSLTECNNLLRQIRVDFYEAVKGVCHVPVEIFMYKGDSNRLADYMMIWGVKSTDECVNVRATHPAFEMTSAQDSIFIGQGQTIPLDMSSNVHVPGMKGILHTRVQAKHGLVTLTVPTGMRVYLDHMGQHSDMVTYFCMSGPAYEVIAALKTAKFTPLKNFKGPTEVVVEYGMTSRSLQHTYGIPAGSPIPRQSITTKISIVNGLRPYFPVLSLPEKVCTMESELLPLDQIRLERRYTEDEIVTVSLYADKGTMNVDQNIAALYECPAMMDTLTSCSNIDECYTDDTCPGTQHCCTVAPDCGKQCIEPVEVGMVNSYNPHNVVMHGKITTLNRVFEDTNVWYISKPCQEDDMGQPITDRQIDWQADTIRISVIPARNPEGDSVIKYFNVNVTCDTPVNMPVTPPQEIQPEPECNVAWSEWSNCAVVDNDACGIGMQQRVRQCQSQHVEDRPCLKCDCQVQNRTISNPDYMQRMCESTRPISTCPITCEVENSHYESVEFRCVAEDQQDTTFESRNVKVDDDCTCRTCSAYDVDKFGRLTDRTSFTDRNSL